MTTQNSEEHAHLEAGTTSTPEPSKNEFTSSQQSYHPAGTAKAWLTGIFPVAFRFLSLVLTLSSPQVLGCFLIQFSTVASVNSFGVFQDYYTTTFLPSSSASRISWIIGLEIFLQLGLGMVGGKL